MKQKNSALGSFFPFSFYWLFGVPYIPTSGKYLCNSCSSGKEDGEVHKYLRFINNQYTTENILLMEFYHFESGVTKSGHVSTLCFSLEVNNLYDSQQGGVSVILNECDMHIYISSFFVFFFLLILHFLNF